MGDRIVIVALGVSIACFLLVVIWPLIDDDPVSPKQLILFGAGSAVAVAGAVLYLGRPR